MKIQTKLILLLTSFSLVLILVFTLFIRWSMDKGMTDYVNKKDLQVISSLRQELIDIHQQDGDWHRFVDDKNEFRLLLIQQLFKHRLLLVKKRKEVEKTSLNNKSADPSLEQERYDNNTLKSVIKQLPPHYKKQIRSKLNYLLLNENKLLISGKHNNKIDYRHSPITFENELLGYIAIPKKRPVPRGEEREFLDRQIKHLWVMALALMALVVLFTIPLARHLVKPLKKLATSIHELTLGNFEPPRFSPRGDEIGQLQQDQTKLAETLKHNENIRNQWLANTSHELRTPIAIMRGELEAMVDGVRSLDKHNINSVLHEVAHLQHLVDDLHQLNRAVMGELDLHQAPVALSEFVQTCLQDMAGYLSSHKINYSFQPDCSDCTVLLDGNRFKQVLENIINNTIKYGGSHSRLLIRLEHREPDINIFIEDNGPGVEEEHLAHIFDHLYRVESSRNRQTGGSGLGLAICNHIILSHQGEMSAFHSSLGGLGIKIQVPCYATN